MLIEFKAKNYRSLREWQTFSMVASSDKSLTCCLIDNPLPGLSNVRFLKGAALYGANASGKSNVLSAVMFLADLVKRSATEFKPGDSTGAEPFKLDAESSGKASEFEITFVADSVRFRLYVSLTRSRIIEEYLDAFPKGVAQRWYHRTFDLRSETYKWRRSAVGFKQDKSLQEKTRDNALFLSTGPQFNHPQLTPVFNWFKSNLRFLDLGAETLVHPEFSTKLLESSKHRSRMLELLRHADIGVDGATKSERPISREELRMNLPPRVFASLKEEDQSPIIEVVSLTHKAGAGESVPLDFENEESAGTRRFYFLVGPWLDILEKGYTVFIDEIETSLHPLLVRELLNVLFADRHNPKGAQVIFTTHSPTLLDTSLLRRDQIWFAEKSPEGATHIYPLTDFQPRKDEAIAKGYLAGRYGAIPMVAEGLLQ